MAWRRPGDKPLSQPMMVNLPTHICVTWPQWVKIYSYEYCVDDIIKNTKPWLGSFSRQPPFVMCCGHFDETCLMYRCYYGCHLCEVWYTCEYKDGCMIY